MCEMLEMVSCVKNIKNKKLQSSDRQMQMSDTRQADRQLIILGAKDYNICASEAKSITQQLALKC